MTPQEFADRINVVRAPDRAPAFANTHQKISALQADWILSVLEIDGRLAGDLGKHLYGPMLDPPNEPAAETETESEEQVEVESVESKMRNPATMRAMNQEEAPEAEAHVAVATEPEPAPQQVAKKSKR